MKRMLAAILCLTLLLAMVPAVAATNDRPAHWDLSFELGDQVTYSVDQQARILHISGTGAMWDFDDDPRESADPNYIPWPPESPFSFDAGVAAPTFDTVEVERGVTTLGDEVFALCSYIRRVYLPDTLEKIGRFAFYCFGTPAEPLEIYCFGDAPKLDHEWSDRQNVTFYHLPDARGWEEIAKAGYAVKVFHGSTFVDVPAESWFEEPVAYCAQRELMLGTGEHTFSPKAVMTRAMFVTVLYRIDQKLSQSAPTEPEKTEPTQVTPTQPTAPTAEPTVPTAPTEPNPALSDVKQDAYYAEAVAWAVENGVVQGYPDGTFRPDGTILRQDVACVVARYVKAAYPDLFRVPICEFEPIDMDNASQYAKTDIYFMADQDLMKGDENERFNPKSDLNRAEAATLLMRLYQRLTGETWQDWGKQG